MSAAAAAFAESSHGGPLPRVPATVVAFIQGCRTPLVLSPVDLGKLIVEETEKWAKVIKFAGIKAE
jgi:hypothetical protein